MIFVNIEHLPRNDYLKVEGKDEHESVFLIKSVDYFIDLLKLAADVPVNSAYKEITELESFLDPVEKNDRHITKSLESNNISGLFYKRMITDLKGEITFSRGQTNKCDTYLQEEIKFFKRKIQKSTKQPTER